MSSYDLEEKSIYENRKNNSEEDISTGNNVNKVWKGSFQQRNDI